jgi:hypothetical protein
MAARGPVDVRTMRQFPGKLGLPASPGFDFNADVIECALDSWS